MSGGPPEGPDPRLVSAAAMVFVDDPAAPALGEGDAHHLSRVLRLRPDETVIASDGAGRWSPCRLIGESTPTGPSGVHLEVEGPVIAQGRPEPAVTVAFVPTKGDRPEWVVQKLTELGVDRMVPLRSARSVVRWEGPRAGRAVDRLRRVAREAAAQSRRTWLPEVTEVMDLEGLAEAVGSAPCLAAMGGAPPGLDQPVIAVGPEGGWDPAELERWGTGIGLGPTVLRSETAAVAAGAVLCGLRSGVVGPFA
jgi:16S rRNA (uracil1498-N3)-methyltransferase